MIKMLKKEGSKKVMEKGSMTPEHYEDNENVSEKKGKQEYFLKNEDCNQKTMISVNKLLTYMTTLDYVKQMIRDANRQAELVESVAASSEEMSSSNQEISTHVIKSGEMSKKSIENNSKSLQEIKSAFSVLKENIKQTGQVKEVISEVNTETEKIYGMVNVIKSVADQTNLLALNASIEAARAGEAGKGFAVVADEIKKLAESTRQQVTYIQDIVNSLNGKMKKTTEEIDHVMKGFEDSEESIMNAVDGISHITDSMNILNDSFQEISANVQEQTAVSEEMAASLMIINEKAETLKGEANHTGAAFYDISSQIDEIRLRAIGVIQNVNKATMIEIAITDHLMWKWKIYNMILGYVKLDESSVGDSNGCRLGKFIRTLDQSDLRVNGIIAKITKPHSSVHENAKKAIQAYQRGNMAEAEKALELIDNSSMEVMEQLKLLEKVLS